METSHSMRQASCRCQVPCRYWKIRPKINMIKEGYQTQDISLLSHNMYIYRVHTCQQNYTDDFQIKFWRKWVGGISKKTAMYEWRNAARYTFLTTAYICPYLCLTNIIIIITGSWDHHYKWQAILLCVLKTTAQLLNSKNSYILSWHILLFRQSG